MVEIDRSRHIGKRRSGKSDPIDAVRAAKEFLARPNPAEMRADGDREALRVLMVDRDHAVECVRSARAVLTSLIVTAPAELREQLRGLTRKRARRRAPSCTAPKTPTGRPGCCTRAWPGSVSGSLT